MKISPIPMSLGPRGSIVRNSEGSPQLFIIDCRTYFAAFCFLIQFEVLFNIPTLISISEVDLSLPASEEEWIARTAEEWEMLRSSTASSIAPPFKEAFRSFFTGTMENVFRRSEFGGYVLISAIQSAILNSYRMTVTPAVSIDWGQFDAASDAWQRAWIADLNPILTARNNMGVMAFNASAIYRATSVRRVRDYSRSFLLNAPLTVGLKQQFNFSMSEFQGRKLSTL